MILSFLFSRTKDVFYESFSHVHFLLKFIDAKTKKKEAAVQKIFF